MKADFEKGTKICSRCRKELPLNMFGKNKNMNDGMQAYCKECAKEYFKNKHGLMRNKTAKNPDFVGSKRKINQCRRARISDKRDNYSLLIYVDKKRTIDMTPEEYSRALHRDWNKQQRMAVKGKKTRFLRNGTYDPIFVFSFRLEEMLRRKVHINSDKNCVITKWWNGRIKYWTILDGIWKEEEK